jgi:chorismate lyase / 3-hydroxybenzoate synthase
MLRAEGRNPVAARTIKPRLECRIPHLAGAGDDLHTPEPHDDPVLAVVRLGAAASDGTTWFEASVPCPPLGDGLSEVWPASAPVSRCDLGSARAACDGRVLFASVVVPVTARAGIERATFGIYRRLLADLERTGYPHLLRIWNYVPSIHDRSEGLERYMLFCKGRAEAFAAHHGEGFAARLPAASAVGWSGRSLVVHLVASRESGRHFENPRQTSAYRYPERYGPASPSFARATAVPSAAGGGLFVSGTASVLGSESVHPGDPARQTKETMANIASVLDASGVPGSGGPLGARLGFLRAYVRRPEDAGAIRAEIERAGAGGAPVAWLRADICREELLVEIEAVARTSTRG